MQASEAAAKQQAQNYRFARLVDAIFLPRYDIGATTEFRAAQDAFVELVGDFITFCGHEKLLNNERVRIDFIAFQGCLKRFHRDAYGVKHFKTYLRSLETSGVVKPDVIKEIFRRVSLLSVRINSPDPKKTRVAAAFSLWFAVSRPVHFTSDAANDAPREFLEHFNALLNFWIASNFLSKFGKIILPELPDREMRMDRIKQDFTNRDISLSSLEMFYCGLFRPEPPKGKVVLSANSNGKA